MLGTIKAEFRSGSATPLQDVLGSAGDPDVLEYVAGSLEDGDFDYGNEGQEAYEAFAGVLVRGLVHQATLLPSH